MSSAFYPLGMRPTPASGYNHASSLPCQYISWKGTGLSKTPVGVTAGTIRPLTNKDYGNIYPAAFGKPRPIKHARKGVIPRVPVSSVANVTSEAEFVEIDRNLNRDVKSSTLGSLVKQMIDNPGSFSVKENTVNTTPDTCKGVCVSAELYPNLPYLTDNPEPFSGTPTFCCNEERKARRRCLPASTNLNKNYYTTHTQYMENRCQTYDQRAFNFQGPEPKAEAASAAKPGAPGSSSLYIANCYPNGEIQSTGEAAIVSGILTLFKNQGLIDSVPDITTFKELVELIGNASDPTKTDMARIYASVVLNPYSGMPITGPSNPMSCKYVVYKPNNYQFAKEGAVSSSTLNLKRNVNTIDTNLARLSRNTIIYKNKTTPCRPQYYIKNGNNKTCSLLTRTAISPSLSST